MQNTTEQVLSYLHSQGCIATTSQIIEGTDIEDRNTVRYHLNKLVDLGVIETRVVGNGGNRVTEAIVTEEGENSISDALSRIESNQQYLKDCTDGILDAQKTNAEKLCELIMELDEQGLIDVDDYL